MATTDLTRGDLTAFVNTLGHPKVYLPVIVAILALPVPFVLRGFYVHIFILVFLIGSCAVAWNIIGGFGGQFSLGNAMFFGVGGYTTGILMVDHGYTKFLHIAEVLTWHEQEAVPVGY